MARGRRKPKGKKINPTFFIFCEGQTEEAYINVLKAEYRLPSIIIHSKVKGLDISARFIKEYKKNKPSDPKDRTFLFYDLDTPGIYSRLVQIDGCKLLISNPSVELWFLLHYKNQTASINSDRCCKELEKENKEYKKGTIDTKLRKKLIDNIKIAIERAKSLPNSNNPSSTVYQFLEILNGLES